MSRNVDETNSRSRTVDHGSHIVWLSLSLSCAAVDVAYLGLGAYATFVDPLQFTADNVLAAILGMIIYSVAVFLGTGLGVWAGIAGGFGKRSILTYIGIATGPFSLLIVLLAN